MTLSLGDTTQICSLVSDSSSHVFRSLVTNKPFTMSLSNPLPLGVQCIDNFGDTSVNNSPDADKRLDP